MTEFYAKLKVDSLTSSPDAVADYLQEYLPFDVELVSVKAKPHVEDIDFIQLTDEALAELSRNLHILSISEGNNEDPPTALQTFISRLRAENFQLAKTG